MNQQVNEVIDVDQLTPDIDLVKNLQIPKDWHFDMYGPRFQLFVAGHAINKQKTGTKSKQWRTRNYDTNKP